MVHYKKDYGKCHVCRRSKPRSWFRCNLCGVWMGYHCEKANHVHAREWLEVDSRFETNEVSLHCYIWTSEERSRERRADLCKWCCEHRILGRGDRKDTEIPVESKRYILKLIGWGSWW